jgi:hypothetical protein
VIAGALIGVMLAGVLQWFGFGIGVGGSVGRMTMDFEVDDDQLFWDVSYHFTGVMAHVAVYF